MIFRFRYVLFVVFLYLCFIIGAIIVNETYQNMADQSARSETTDQTNQNDVPAKIDSSFFTSVTTAPAPRAPTAAKPASVPVSAPAPIRPRIFGADEIGADSYLVGDVQTGKIYLEKNASAVLPFASMSKLVTAIIATKLYSATDTILITPADTEVPSDDTGLHAGESFTVNELLYPMLLASSNIAAEALASHVDRIKFLEAMSSFAWGIGMSRSYFADPTGLSEHNAGTAEGFFALARYLYSERRDLLAITMTAHDVIASTTTHAAHDLKSIHPFVNDPRFLGGKTGHTEYALDTMLTIMNIDDHPIAIIVLHSPYRREEDTKILITKAAAILTVEN